MDTRVVFAITWKISGITTKENLTHVEKYVYPTFNDALESILKQQRSLHAGEKNRIIVDSPEDIDANDIFTIYFHYLTESWIEYLQYTYTIQPLIVKEDEFKQGIKYGQYLVEQKESGYQDKFKYIFTLER